MVPDRSTLDRFIVTSSPDGIMVFEPGGTVVYANAAAASILGHEDGTMGGMHVSGFLPTAYREGHESHRASFHANPSSRPMGLGRELKALRSDGVLIPVEISLSPLPDSPEKWVVATLRDVTERRQLRSLGAATLAAAERERKRIAQELHDDVLQRLAAMLLSIKLLTNRQDHPDESALFELRNQIEDAAIRLRRLARGLRPKELEEVGLEIALRRLIRELEEAGGPTVEFTCDAIHHAVPEMVSLALFRIVQEGIWNAHRHANAQVIRVTAGCEESSAHVVIEDNGIGFDLEETRRSDRGLGLRGMFERTAAVRGRFDITSVPGQGTRIHAVLPYGDLPNLGDDAT